MSSSSPLRRSSLVLLRLSSRRLVAPAVAAASVPQLSYHHRCYHASSTRSAAIATTIARPSLAMGPRQKRLEATAVPQERTYESDLVVVLDMDECLIHSQFLSDRSSAFAHQLTQKSNGSNSSSSWNSANNHLNGDDSTVVDTFDVTLPDGDLVKVHERPHLHDFLDKVSDRFETHVFTAAMEIYAKPVLDTLDPLGHRFAKRWYRESCVQTKEGAFVKNLGVLQKNEARIVLVDNNPLSFLANPSNGILVSSFYNDAGDKTLLAVLALLDEIDAHDDVRPHLDRQFGLKTALEEVTKNGLP